MTVGWIRFLAMLLPDAKDLLRELYELYKGDVVKARAKLVHITNHSLRLDLGEAEIDRRMQAVKDAEPPKESA